MLENCRKAGPCSRRSGGTETAGRRQKAVLRGRQRPLRTWLPTSPGAGRTETAMSPSPRHGGSPRRMPAGFSIPGGRGTSCSAGMLAGRYLGVSDDRHILTVSGSRAGKGVSLVTPNLLFWPGSVLAIDPKGELASLTASRRSDGGSAWSLPMTPGEGEVYALDPFERVTGPARQFRGAFNPLADLDPEFGTGPRSRLDDRRCARDPVAG